MQLSDKGLALIQEFESYLIAQPDGSCKAYKCPAGVWTVGFGLTVGVTADTRLTRAEADAAFKRELATHEKLVDRLVTVSITQSQFDALVSFSYNCGALETSTLLKKLNKKDYLGAADEFRYFTKARNPKTGKKEVLRGLVRRRKAEAALFTSDMPGAQDMPQAAVESRPLGIILKENKETIAAVATVAGGGGTAVIKSAPEQKPAKPTAKEQIAKAQEYKTLAEQAKDLGTFGVNFGKWAAGDGMLVVGLIAAGAVVAVLGPRIKERLS